MDLQKLFEIQKVLRDRIAYNEPDRFDKLILALLVEIGECANEWRGFKFWSVNQLPHTSAVRVPCMMDEDKEFYNPLLEEYVDGLHFVLELGLELGIENFNIRPLKYKDVTKQFNVIFRRASKPRMWISDYIQLCDEYLGLGEMLGFTWEQIEQAYLEKNQMNHRRQDNGY